MFCIWSCCWYCSSSYWSHLSHSPFALFNFLIWQVVLWNSLHTWWSRKKRKKYWPVPSWQQLICTGTSKGWRMKQGFNWWFSHHMKERMVFSKNFKNTSQSLGENMNFHCNWRMLSWRIQAPITVPSKNPQWGNCWGSQSQTPSQSNASTSQSRTFTGAAPTCFDATGRKFQWQSLLLSNQVINMGSNPQESSVAQAALNWKQKLWTGCHVHSFIHH